MRLKASAINLIPLDQSNYQLLRLWRNQNRRFFADSRYISKANHQLWFNTYSTNPTQKMYLVTVNGKPVGAAGLKLKPPRNPDFGPYLLGDKAYIRQGIMLAALKKLIKLHPAPHYHGQVKKNNPAALALDKKLGFKITKEDKQFWYVELTTQPSQKPKPTVYQPLAFIPLLQPNCSLAEIKAVTAVLKSGWWGLGPVTKEFEVAFAKFVGTKYAVAVNSCTSALHLAVKILKGNNRRGNLITTPLTFVSTAAVALYEGLEVRFGDIDPHNLCLDPRSVTPLIDAQTVAIIPVHYAGHLANTDYLSLSKSCRNPSICARKGYHPDVRRGRSLSTPNADSERFALPSIIEDCAHAAGTPRAGQTGIMACWSFHPVKNIATGDGGMITTNDAKIYQELIRLRWLGIDLDTWAREQKGYNWQYHIPSLGFKYHQNDIQSAIGLAQLQRLPELNRRRRHLAERYQQKLAGLPLTLPQLEGSQHLYVVRIKASLRSAFINYLRSQRISVGVHYQPLHHYPIFKWTKPLPVVDRLFPTLVDLPLYPHLTLKNQNYIIKAIKRFFTLHKIKIKN